MYCEGWDSGTRDVYGAMPESAADERDRIGEQYAVLLRENGRPVALLQVAWSAGYLGVAQLDEYARRVREFDFRVLDDPERLYWFGCRTWLPASPHDPEFFEIRPKRTLQIDPDGRASVYTSLRHRGGGVSGSGWPKFPGELRTIARVPFGDWYSYVGPALFDPGDAPSAIRPAKGARSTGEATSRGWTPPVGRDSGNIEALFTPGARLRCGAVGNWREGEIVTVDAPRDQGTLRLPTGHVLAVDPSTLNERDKPFTVTVPPGEYGVTTALATRETTEPPHTGQSTTAVRLLIRDEPVTTWEMALRPGQDARMLPSGHYFGFGVDTGMGAFLDAAGLLELSARFREAEEESDDIYGLRPGKCWRAEDPESGAGMVVYGTGMGDGSYPVWIGRNSDGQVVSFVADMMALGDAELLTPEAASPARYVLKGTGSGPADETPPARVGDLSLYVDKLLTPLKEAEAAPLKEEPVEMRVSGSLLRRGIPHRPDLRFPDHDCEIELGSKLWNLLHRAEMLHQTTKAYDKALVPYTRAVELDPESTIARAGRGDTLRLLGRHDEALADLDRAIKLFPLFAAAHICRARAYHALGRYLEALAAYDRFEEIGFTGAGSGYSIIDKGNRGDICRHLERYAEALDCFDVVLRTLPHDAVAFHGRGLTRQAMGRDEEAHADLARAAELDPRRFG